MSKGLICVDMDGTLLTPDLKISVKDADALEDAAHKGFTVVIMTGRCPGDAEAFLQEAGLDFQVSALSGTCMLSKGNLELKTVYMDSLAVRELIQILDNVGVEYTLFGETLAACNRKGRSATYWITHPDKSPCEIGPAAIERVIESGVCKMACLLPENNPKEIKEQIIRHVSAVKGIEFTTSAPNNMEFSPDKRNKGSAMRLLADQLNLKREQTFAIGDSDNDLPMMEEAGFAFCMENGSQRARSTANMVVPDNSRNGVAYAVHTAMIL